MVKLFLGNRAGVLLLIPILIYGYFLLNQQTNYYTYKTISNFGFWGESLILLPNIAAISSAILICFNAFGISWIYNTNEFFERNSYMSSLLYVVLLSFYHSFYSIDGLLIAHSCIIVMLFQFFKLNQNKDGRRNVFNGLFFAGIAATFHPPMIVVFPFILIMVWNVRPFVFRETLLGLVAFIIPLIYAGTYLWYSGNVLEFKVLEQTTNYTNKQTDFLVTAVLFTLLFLLSIVSIRGRMQTSSIRLKKLVRILYWLLFIGLLFGVVDFLIYKQIERFSFLMLPLSFFLAFSFIHKTFGMMASILFYLTFAYSIIKFFI